MKYLIGFFLIVFSFTLFSDQRAFQVHHSLEDIKAADGKVQLKLVREWGGEDEKDEKKFFKTPVDVMVSRDQKIYIVDHHQHIIKVFDLKGNYLKSMGRMGKGPGDLFCPVHIRETPDGQIAVFDLSFKIQYFDKLGKSVKVKGYKKIYGWFGINSQNELAMNSKLNTWRSKHLLSIFDRNYKPIRHIAKSHIPPSNAWHLFALGPDDSYYLVDVNTPAIRQYSRTGALIKLITIETPFDLQLYVTLNKDKNDIVRSGRDAKVQYEKIKSKKGFQIKVKGPGKIFNIFNGISVDQNSNIYVVTRTRLLTEKEKKGSSVIWTSGGLIRNNLDKKLVRDIDINQLLVFDSKGELIGKTGLSSFCDRVYVSDNRLFIVDGDRNSRILEYEVSFKKSGKLSNPD